MERRWLERRLACLSLCLHDSSCLTYFQLTRLQSGDIRLERRSLNVEPRSVSHGAEIDKYMYLLVRCSLRRFASEDDAQELCDGEAGLHEGQSRPQHSSTVDW